MVQHDQVKTGYVTYALKLTMHTSAGRRCCWPLLSLQTPCLSRNSGVLHAAHAQAWGQVLAAWQWRLH